MFEVVQRGPIGGASLRGWRCDAAVGGDAVEGAVLLGEKVDFTGVVGAEAEVGAAGAEDRAEGRGDAAGLDAEGFRQDRGAAGGGGGREIHRGGRGDEQVAADDVAEEILALEGWNRGAPVDLATDHRRAAVAVVVLDDRISEAAGFRSGQGVNVGLVRDVEPVGAFAGWPAMVGAFEDMLDFFDHAFADIAAVHFPGGAVPSDAVGIPEAVGIEFADHGEAVARAGIGGGDPGVGIGGTAGDVVAAVGGEGEVGGLVAAGENRRDAVDGTEGGINAADQVRSVEHHRAAVAEAEKEAAVVLMAGSGGGIEGDFLKVVVIERKAEAEDLAADEVGGREDKRVGGRLGQGPLGDDADLRKIVGAWRDEVGRGAGAGFAVGGVEFPAARQSGLVELRVEGERGESGAEAGAVDEAREVVGQIEESGGGSGRGAGNDP